MNKQIIMIMMLAIMVLPLINAEVQSLPAQKQGSCVSIPQTCSNCTYVNVDSITYPNSTKLYLNQVMTNEGYGYSYNFCNTSILGDYIVTTCGDPDGIVTCVNYDFEVTRDGFSYSSSKSSIIGYILLFLLVIFILAVIISFVTKNTYVMIIGIFFAFVFLLFAIQTVMIMPQIEILEKLHSMLGVTFAIVIWIFFAFIFFMALYLLYTVFNLADINKKKKLGDWGLLMEDEH